jgi:hypothetical protein
VRARAWLGCVLSSSQVAADKIKEPRACAAERQFKHGSSSNGRIPAFGRKGRGVLPRRRRLWHVEDLLLAASPLRYDSLTGLEHRSSPVLL